MNLLIRLMIVLTTALFRKPLGLLDESVLSFRVWPNDLDIYGHMNNGRYLTVMDLGRIDLIFRMGLTRIAGKSRWHPLVASSLMRYKRSLPLFGHYKLHTRIVCWNDKWFFIEQKFKVHGHNIAVGLVKGLFYGPKGKVPPTEVVASFGQLIPSPLMPDAIRLWLESESQMTDVSKNT